MIDIELQETYNLIATAVSVEDVFGKVNADQMLEVQLSQLAEAYRKLSGIVDPAAYNADPDAKDIAKDANDQLNLFYEKAQKKICAGLYGSHDPAVFVRGKPSFQTAKRQYYLGPVIARGDIATVYSGECVMGDEFAGRVIIKIVSDPIDNDLAQNEIRTLRFFQQHPAVQRKHLPVLLDHFRTTDDKIGIILRQFDGYDFCAIREMSRYQKGIPEKHMVWMLNRLLSVIGYAHSIGVIHGNIEPTHLMIRPKDHNLLLLDWSYSAIDPSHTGDGFKVYNEDFSPPEVKEQKPPIPSSDLYSIGMCMIYILGGDIKRKTMPFTSVNPELQRFIKYFVLDSPLQRPQDAWQMHSQLDSLVKELWGRKRFLKFEV